MTRLTNSAAARSECEPLTAAVLAGAVLAPAPVALLAAAAAAAAAPAHRNIVSAPKLWNALPTNL